MIDEIWDRNYQAGRNELNAGIDRLVEKIRCSTVKTFRLFHAIQFDAPWARRSKDVGCA
jgi:acetaldehyde dehydrogenase (acetylating)